MSTVKSLEKAWREAEGKAQKLQSEKDDALAKVNDRYGDSLPAAVDAAAAAQQEWLDAQVIESLRDRPDGEAVARTLGLSLE